eukprot:TRINITY_DN13346_c0_g1_i1.p1 TRINITY_DN13346_c0_g1~~TRINITY_DN13346_c0_g1_i1.p1  ORF type:complete len:335 (-),score=47.35 TRINITY_DN13346_c0_g1_i1:812-1816(-)
MAGDGNAELELMEEGGSSSSSSCLEEVGEVVYDATSEEEKGIFWKSGKHGKRIKIGDAPRKKCRIIRPDSSYSIGGSTHCSGFNSESKMGNCVLACGRALTFPMTWSLEMAFKRVNHVPRQGVLFRERSPNIILSILFFFLLFPILMILSIPSFFLGAILRTGIHLVSKADITIISTVPDDEIVYFENASLSIRTQNLGFIPMVSSFNNLASPHIRVDDLIEELQIGKDDVVCLQEQFTTSLSTRLARELLQSAGPYKYMIKEASPHLFKVDSGLCVLSKYPVANVEFVRFSTAKGTDNRMACKGVLGFTLLLHSKKKNQKAPHDLHIHFFYAY